MRYFERHECWSLMYLVCVPIVGCLVGSVVLASIPSIVLRLGRSALCVYFLSHFVVPVVVCRGVYVVSMCADDCVAVYVYC